jgi:hypothetical protein
VELVWNNPNPNRIAYRPSAWEVIGRDGTTKVVAADEIHAIADPKLAHGEKNVRDDVKTSFAAYFCF